MNKTTLDKLAASKTEAEAISILTQALEVSERPIVNIPGPFQRLAFPKGDTYEIHAFPDDQPTPHRLKGLVKLNTTDSFMEFIKLYKGDRSVAIYADIDSQTVTAVFDHLTAALPGWHGFRAVLTMPADPRFTSWVANDRKFIEQEAFAEFLEDHQPFIKVPDAPTLIGIISDLKVNKVVNMQSTKTLRNGNLSLVWDETSTESREVPTRFTLNLPVFCSSRTAYEVTARLRYRFHERQLRWQFVIDQLPDLRRMAFESEVLKIQDLSTLCPIFHGVAP